MNCLWILLLFSCCSGNSLWGSDGRLGNCGCNRGLRYGDGDCGCSRETRYDDGDCGCGRETRYGDGDCGCSRSREARFEDTDCGCSRDCECDNNAVTTSYKSYQSYERKDY